jgi:hypothetical protein
MIQGFYKFEKLPAELKKAMKIRSAKRVDCIAYHETIPNEDIRRFVKKKGMLYFYFTNPECYSISDRKRISEIGLTNGKNFTSLYYNDSEFTADGEYFHAYGDYAEDGYLFKVNIDLSAFEMYWIPNAKYSIMNYYQMFLDSELDEYIEPLKNSVNTERDKQLLTI